MDCGGNQPTATTAIKGRTWPGQPAIQRLPGDRQNRISSGAFVYPPFV